MSTDLIRYDVLVQDALKGVVRKILSDTVRDGLKGEHHYYVTFRTGAPGVRLSQRLREKYPDEMTIVLQHQFWDLGVTEHAFEVGLSFGSVPERLLIPFDAISGFYDPSVQFGLKFELAEEGDADETVSGHEPASPSAREPAKRSRKSAGREEQDILPNAPRAAPAPQPVALTRAKGPRDLGKQSAEKALEPPIERPPGLPPSVSSRSVPDKPSNAAPKNASFKDNTPKNDAPKNDAPKNELPKNEVPRNETQKTDEAGAAVVSLDAFRKKK